MNTHEQPDTDLPTQFRWMGLSLSFWALFASLALHSSVMIPAFLSDVRADYDADVEWLQSLDDLEGLGSSGRWAEVKIDEEKPEPEPEEIVEDPEPEVVEPEPEPVKPKPAPKPKPAEMAKNDQKPKETAKPEETEKPDKKKKLALDRTGPSQLPSMEAYGPGNAVYSALVRMDRIRNTPFESVTNTLIQAVPDYRIALEHTGIDPVGDLDSMFMASARPQYLEHTFLAVRHRMSQQDIQRRLDRRYERVPKWEKYNSKPTRNLVPENPHYDDSRKIFLPSNGLAVLTRPEWLPRLTSKRAVQKGEKGTMLQGLRQIENAAAASDTLVLVSANKIRFRLPGMGKITLDSVKASVQNIDRPKVTIDMQFDTAERAATFAKRCPKLKKTAEKRAGFFSGTVRLYLGRLTCTSSENFATIQGTYSQTEMERLMKMLVTFVPNPPVLTQLPQAPTASKRKTLEAQKKASKDASSKIGVPQKPIEDTGPQDVLDPTKGSAPDPTKNKGPKGDGENTVEPKKTGEKTERPDADSDTKDGSDNPKP